MRLTYLKDDGSVVLGIATPIIDHGRYWTLKIAIEAGQGGNTALEIADLRALGMFVYACGSAETGSG